MAKHVLTLIAALIACTSQLMAQNKAYTLKIGDFSEFTVAHNLNVTYKCSTDSAGYAAFECSPKVAHALTFTNNKGKIKIEVLSENPITETLPHVTLYSATLDKATNLGDSTVVLQQINPGEKLSLKIVGNGVIKALDVYTTSLSAAVEAGSGHIYVNGKTKDAKYTVAGAGVIESADLEAQNVKAWMLGIGAIDCDATKNLSVYGAGSGTIYYKGTPEIKKRNIGVKLVAIGNE